MAAHTTPKRKFSDLDDQTKVACWMHDKNGMGPDQVAICSQKKYWFKCDVCEHVFEKCLDKISSRGQWCPCCSKKNRCDDKECALCFKKTFAAFHDKGKVEAWSSRNTMSPRDVALYSLKKFWFTCNVCEHDFEKCLANVSAGGTWCPFCNNGKRCEDSRECNTCLVKTFFAFHDKKKVECWSKDNVLRPWEVALNTHEKFKFDCGVCGHTFEARLNSVNRGRWCPFCAITNKKRCEDPRSCQYCFSKTFASFDEKRKVECWSDRNNLRPWQVSRGSGEKYWFTCSEETCGHDFEMALSDVTSPSRTWCPFCANRQRCEDPRECKVCFPKTFASFSDKDKVACWSDRNILRPWQVAMGCERKKFLFKCSVCHHHFDVIPNSVTKPDGTWCPYCSGNKRCASPTEESCLVCFKRTFAAFHDKEKVAAWSSRNTVSPHDVALNSNKKFWFTCSMGHEFIPTLSNVTKSEKGSWCPRCQLDAPMKKLCEVLEGRGIRLDIDKTVRIKGRILYWDVVCDLGENKTFYIESDGPQHFSSHGVTRVSRGVIPNPEEMFQDQRMRDLLKDEYIRENGLLLFRFSYRQVEKLEELVSQMVSHVEKGDSGRVVYMDPEIYWG